MFRKVLVCNVLLAALAQHAHAQVLTAPCSVPASVTVGNPVVVTTAANVDTGALITNAIAQALASGTNTVIVNSGVSTAPMTTSVVLNNLSNFTLQLNSTSIFGYGLAHTMFTINGGSNVKILGGKLLAGTPGLNAPSCVAIVGNDSVQSNNIELGGFECSATTSHGIVLQGSGSTYANIQNVSIHNTLIHDTGSVNISASGVNRLCMKSNVLVNPATGGVNGSGDPANVAVAYSENVYFGQNYVAGTPVWFRQPNPTNTPPTGIYAFSSMNVNTDSNYFVNSQCTVATCSGTGNLPSSPSAVHDDTVLNAININNVVDSYGIGITCELSWSCNATGGAISNVYDYGVYDESNNSTIQVNPLTSTAGLASFPNVTLQTVNDSVNGNATSVVQASIPGTGAIFSQNLGSAINFGVEPFPSLWVKSANGQPADGLELWVSATGNLLNAHTKFPLPALPAGQWVQVGLQPAHLTLMGLLGVQTWGLVNAGNPNSDTVRVSTYSQIADSRNNTYTGVSISGTGAYPLAVSGCGSNTTLSNNTILNSGSVGVWPYYNSGLIGQVFIGGYNNCTRTGVYFTNNTTNLNIPLNLGGSALFNLSNYGANNTISNVVLTHDTAVGPYASVQNNFIINNQGANSTIASPIINP